MKKILLNLFFVISAVSLFAQHDTIKVQTLTWDATTRSGNFVFPEKSEGPYEKIIMKYNMRCHNAAVGNGDVGCREWDYSCNTFITVPELQDSTFRTHPSHLITNFDDNFYDYSINPVFKYYQHNQYNTTYTYTSGPNVVAVGEGEAILTVVDNQNSTKMYMLFSAEELQSSGLQAGEITSLDLNFGELSVALKNLKLKLKHTNQSVLDANELDMSGFQEVMFRDVETNNNWNTFDFYSAFNWDGSSNILIEMSVFNNADLSNINLTSSGTTNNTVLYSTDQHNTLRFEGAGSLSLDPESFSNITDEITISMWTYGSDAMPKNSTLFEGVDPDNNRQINVHLPWGNGRIYWDCGNDGNGPDRIDKEANASDYKGKWNHWAFTKNASTGSMRMYLNGNLWHSGSGKTKNINLTALDIAGSLSWINKYFGQINEVRIFNKSLDKNTIEEWMHRTIDVSHPNYDNLMAYYPLNEGEGNVVQDNSSFGKMGDVLGFADWQQVNAEYFYKGFKSGDVRPNLRFSQGAYTRENEEILVVDSIANSPNQVVSYEVDGQNNLLVIDTNYYWEGGYTILLDEDGEIVDYLDAPIDGSIVVTTLDYTDKRDAKLELLSMVTPYGNGLDLGDGGKTFSFDVTDFSPVLHGERFLSVEFGAWQEDLDISFLFIKGTPTRDVLGISNVWPFERGNYEDILTDKKFEPRNIKLDAAASSFKLKSSVTGHGQNGEFVKRIHYLDLDDGNKKFNYYVWKECASNPIYPQGGTWIFDRAGWCPGMATDVHEFEIGSFVTPGENVKIDYGLSGAFLTEANYLVSNQLVSYGAPNFSRDASIVDIKRPSNKVEHERINPSCHRPLVTIKNTGSEEITSLTITYNLQGGNTLSYNWTGTLPFLETVEIELPADDLKFWQTDQENKVFEVRLSGVNGSIDEYQNNNYRTSSFTEAKVFESSNITLQMKTNNKASDNSYTIKDGAGNVVLSRSGMANNTTYKDDINLPPGCYSLDFVDTAGDGLYFWFFASNGSGNLYFLDGGTVLHNFNADFGNGVKYDFVIPDPLGSEEIDNAQRFSVFPNPVAEELNIELTGYKSQNIGIEIFDVTGKKMSTFNIDHYSGDDTHQVNVDYLQSGMYFVKINANNKTRTRKIVVNK